MLQIFIVIVIIRSLMHVGSDLRQIEILLGSQLIPSVVIAGFLSLSYVEKCGVLVVAMFVLLTGWELLEQLKSLLRWIVRQWYDRRGRSE